MNQFTTSIEFFELREKERYNKFKAIMETIYHTPDENMIKEMFDVMNLITEKHMFRDIPEIDFKFSDCLKKAGRKE